MAQAEKKPNILARTKKYLREMKSELKKVVWPSKRQLFNNTGVVILCSIVVGAFIWIFDAVGGLFVQGLISLFS